MKRSVKILLAILMVSLLVLSLSACQDPCADGHLYTPGEITKQPTCTSEGERTYTCSRCGQTFTQSIGKLPHSLQTLEGKPATCADAGLTSSFKCSVCGEVIPPQEAIPMLPAHTWDNGTVTTEPKCKDGEITFKCTVCGATRTEQLVARHNYDNGVLTVAPTCGDYGQRVYTCKDCGATYQVLVAPMADQHVFGPWVEETDQFFGHFQCQNCGKYFDKDGNLLPSIDKNAHVCAHKCSTCGKCQDPYCEDPACADKCECIIDPEGALRATMEYTTKSTTNMKDGNNAQSVGLNASVFNITDTRAEGYSSHVGLNTNGQIRLYTKQNVTLNIAIEGNRKIAHIKVILDSKSPTTLDDLKVVVGVHNVKGVINEDKNEGQYAVNGTSVHLSNVNENKNDQIYIKQIIITYVDEGGEVQEHVCQHVCEVCGKCTSDCADPACTDKCPGHEVASDAFTPLEKPRTGEYYLGMYSTDKSAWYYFTGVMGGFSNYYYATSTEKDSAALVVVEASGSGYHFKVKSSGNYLNLGPRGTDYTSSSLSIGATATTVWTWDATKGVFYTELSNSGTTTRFYLGNYSANTDLSGMKYFNDGNYAAVLGTFGPDSGGGSEEHVCQHQCPTCGKCTSDCADPACTDKCLGHESEVPNHVTDKTIDDLVATAPTGADKLYEVVGIWVPTGGSSDKYGNGYLVDPVSGKQLTIYGMAADESAFTYDASSGYTFTNPQNYQTIFGKSFVAGDSVKLGVVYNTTFSNYYSYFISKEQDKADFKYSASVTAGANGSATLSKTTDLVYGENVTINITPNGGYKVSEVTLNGSTKDIVEQDGVYSFAVVPGPNVINVEFIDEGAVVTEYELTTDSLHPGKYEASTAKVSEITFSYNVGDYGKGIQMRKDEPSFIQNTDVFPRKIVKIVFQFKEVGYTDQNVIQFAWGTDAALTGAVNSTLSTTKGTLSYTVTAPTTGDYTFFKITHSSSGHTLYIDKITIYLDETAPCEHTSLTKHYAVAADCATGTDGNDQYWECDDCHQLFSDEQHQKPIDAIPTTKWAHTYSAQEVAQVPAKCEKDGVEAHYTCTVCNKTFIKDGDSYVEQSDEQLKIPQLGHDYAGQSWQQSAEGKTHYQECKNGCGTKNVADCNTDDWEQTDKTHQKKCSDCGRLDGTAEEHTFVEHVCSACGFSEHAAQVGGEYFKDLAAALNKALTLEGAQTIKLLADNSGAGLRFTEHTGKITIDLGEFTYTVNAAVGSAGTESQALQVLPGAEVEIKGGTIAAESGKGIVRLVNNYGNLTLNGVTLDATNVEADCDAAVVAYSGELTLTNVTFKAVPETAYALSATYWSNYPDGVQVTVDELTNFATGNKGVEIDLDTLKGETSLTGAEVTVTFAKEQRTEGADNYTIKVLGSPCDKLTAVTFNGTTKTQISHNYAKKSGEESAKHVCAICGDEGEHTIGYSNGTKANHTEKCSKCDYEATVEHTLVVKDGSYNTSETHTIWCEKCTYSEDEAHTDEIQVRESGWDEATHDVKCTKCQAEYKKEHKFDQPGNKCLCGYTQEEKEPVWELVTSASKAIAVGDRIVIVASTADMAMCTTQKTNNRDGVAITKNAETKTVTITKTVQVITIEQGNKDGTLAFKVDTGYLYAADSSKNYLRTKTDLDDDGSWKIQVDANGTATVTAQGTNTHNLLKYNLSSKLFSCYASGMQDIQIYRYTGSGEIVYPEDPVGPGGGGDSGGGGTGGTAGAKWVLLTDVGDLKAGSEIVIVNQAGTNVAGALNGNYLSDISKVVVSGNEITTLPDGALILTLVADNSNWKLKTPEGKFLGMTGASKNKLAYDSGTMVWEIKLSTNNEAIIRNTFNKDSWQIQYNSGRFSNYKNTTENPKIYVKTEE